MAIDPTEVVRLYVDEKLSTLKIGVMFGKDRKDICRILEQQGVTRRTTWIAQERRCWSCKETKPLVEFGSAPSKPSGRTSTCKVCVRNNKRDSGIHLAQYGMTLKDFDDMLERQGGCCAICNTPADKERRRLSVDHDHATGKVRGLLCHGCNVALGYMDDDTDRLYRAIEYLKLSK